MIGWIVRMTLSIAGVITGWFVAREATNFGLIQMVVATGVSRKTERSLEGDRSRHHGPCDRSTHNTSVRLQAFTPILRHSGAGVRRCFVDHFGSLVEGDACDCNVVSVRGS